MKKQVYADNAATSQLDIEAFEEMKKFMVDSYGNASQPYSFSRNSKLALKNARKIIAKCISAEEDEIFFTSGGTESDNWALKCFGLSNKKHIITSQIEHHAILNTCKTLKENGTKISLISVNRNGVIDSAEFAKVLENNKNDGYETLVSFMMANNEIGTIEPIEELSKIAHSYNCIFHTDAVQAVGHIKIDVKKMGIDMLSASSHKFNGPKGVGFLYIKKGTNLKSLIDGGSQEFGYRAGTENVPAIVGMAKALENNIKHLCENQEKLKLLEKTFIDELKNNNIEFVINGDNNHLPGLINISIKNSNGEMLLHRLDLMGCFISTGSACDSIKNQISHVIKAIDVDKLYAEGTIRISFGKFNSIDDSVYIAKMLKTIISKN